MQQDRRRDSGIKIKIGGIGSLGPYEPRKHDLGAEEPEGKDPGPEDAAVRVPEGMPIPHVGVSGLGDEPICD